MKKNQNVTLNRPTRPRKRVTFLLVISFLFALLVGLVYINWRAFYTLNYNDGLFTIVWSYLLLLSEVYTFMIFTSFSLALIRKDQNPIDKIEREPTLSRYPSVDIFVCTYNESLEILNDTFIGCTNIAYPNKKVYVLDDGKRPQVKELAEKLGCYYITRPKNIGYKAGNINNAMSQTNGELVLIFDADHVPVSTFLDELIHHFEDEKVALIQSPQHFFNPDPFQKNLSLEKHLANEQDLFYRVIEPGLASFESAVCCGTNFIVKRKYVEEVGGFPEDTVTEDSALGLRLESKGYKILYYNKPIAAGRAPETFSEYIKQRSRWAKGNLQIFMNLQNLRYILKLNPIQLFFHFNGMLYFMYSFPRMIFLLTPVLFLLFNVWPITAVVIVVVVMQASYYVLKLLFAHTNCGKYRHAMITDVYESATAVFLAGEIIGLFLVPSRFNKQKFAVTDKGGSKEGFEWKYFMPVFLITVAIVIAMIKGIWDIFHGSPHPGATGINLFWNFYNLVVMLYAIRVVIEKPELRKHLRVPTSINTQLINSKNEILPVTVSNLSKGGALIKVIGENINVSNFEEFLSDKLYLMLPDKSQVEIKLVNGVVEEKVIYLQAKFSFKGASQQVNQDPLSRDRQFINIMYENSYSWE